MAPCSLNLATRYRQVPSFAALLQEGSPLLTGQDVGRAPEWGGGHPQFPTLISEGNDYNVLNSSNSTCCCAQVQTSPPQIKGKKTDAG